MCCLVSIDRAIAVIALVIAAVALYRTRRLAKRVERLTESYWELRYDHGQLRARFKRLDPEQQTEAAPDVGRPAGTTAFVPLSSLKQR